MWAVSWDPLIEMIRASTAECLQIEDRIRFFGEPRDEAIQKYSACERSYDRTWRIPEEYR